MTTLLMACARRVPIFRKRTCRSLASGIRMRRMSSSGAMAVCRYAVQKSCAAIVRSPRALPDQICASVARSTGSVSPAGEAFDDVAARACLGSGSARRRWWRPPRPAPAGIADERRAPDLGVGRQRAEHDGPAVDRDTAQLIQLPEVKDPAWWIAELAGDLHHQVRPARDGPQQASGEQPVGVHQRRRRLDRRLDGTWHSLFDDAGDPTGGQRNRVDDLGVARAAAQVAGDRLADAVVGRLGAGVDEGLAPP